MMKNIIYLQQTLLSNQQKDLKEQLNPIILCLQKIKDFMKGDEDITSKYINSYVPSVRNILQNLQEHLQIQKKTKHYSPSTLPAPRKTIVENINLTKQSYMQMHQFQIQLQQSLEEMIKNESQLSFTQQTNEKQKNQNQQDINTQTTQLECTLNKIEQDLFTESKYIKLNKEIDEVKKQMQECEKNINMFLLSLDKLKSFKQNLEVELTNLKNEQNKITTQIKEATNNYEQKKEMYESIQKKHQQEIQNLINQFQISQNKIIGQASQQKSKVILLIDEFCEQQHQENLLKEFLQKNLNESDYSIYKYQSEDRFNFSNISLTHKFHLPKLLSSLTKALETIANDNKTNQLQLNIILVGNSQKYEIPKNTGFQQALSLMQQSLSVKKHKTKINIFDKQFSKSVFFNQFLNVFKQNGFDVSFLEDFQILLSKIQKQKIDHNIKQQSNQQLINFNQAQQQINELQQQYSLQVKSQGQIQQEIDKFDENILQEENNIKNMNGEQTDLKQKQQILQNELLLFKEQYQNQKNKEIVIIQDQIKKLQNEQKELEEQNIFIQKVTPLIKDIITQVKQKIVEIKEFKQNQLIENKQLFSILWALYDKEKFMVLSFSLFLLDQEKYFQEESVDYLKKLLQITIQQAKEFYSTLEITFNQDRGQKIVKVNFKCKENSQQKQYQEYLNKLNKIITQESIDIINEIQTYSSLEEFEKFLNKYIQELS